LSTQDKIVNYTEKRFNFTVGFFFLLPTRPFSEHVVAGHTFSQNAHTSLRRRK